MINQKEKLEFHITNTLQNTKQLSIKLNITLKLLIKLKLILCLNKEWKKKFNIKLKKKDMKLVGIDQ